MNPNVSAARVRASLLVFLAFPLGLYSLGAFATSGVNDPSNPKTVGPNDALDNWIVTNGGTLFVNGGTTRDIMVDLGGILSMSNGVVKAATSPTVGAVTLQNNSMGTITGSQITNTSGRALSLTVTGTNGLVSPSGTVSRSQLTGASDGIFMSGGGTLRVDGQSVVDGLGTAGGAALGYGMILNNGQVTVAEGSVIRGKLSGVVVSNATRSAAEDKGRGLVVDGSSIVGLGGPGILVDTQSGTKIATVNIQLVNGASVSGSNGIAVQTGTKGATDLTIDKSDIVGNMVSTGGRFDIVMQNAASVTGAITGIGALGMAGASTWRVTGNSTVSSVALDGSTIDFQPLASGYGRLDVAGNVISNNGRLVMNINLDTVGPEAQQQKNFVGIGGDLMGALGVIVRPEGKGGVTTDLNGNGIIDPDEGFALVGVKGNSSPGSVYLAQPLVVAGLSYGIAASDGSDLGYKTKYSLGVRSCTESGCEPPVIPPVDPPVNPPVTPEPPDVTRPEVGSDVPVLLSLANAMFATNRLLADGWRQREGYSAVGGEGAPWGGNVFVNYINTQQTYSTNRSFQNYGYDADWDIKLAQLGGNLGAWASDGGTLSAFWMLSHGNVRVAPRAVDGQGSANLDLNSFGAGLRYESDRHWWVEGLVSGGRFNGDISTDTGGQYAGRVHASSTTASVESGWSFAIGPRWTLEPTLQVIYQQLSFRDFIPDAFGDAVSLGRGAETSYRAGLRANWAVTDRTMLTARVAATRSVDSTRPLEVTNDTWDLSNRFGVGRSGNNVLLGVGVNSQLTRALNVSAEGAWQSDVGASGARGWSGRFVARYSF